MLNIKVKYNDNAEELYCTFSKERIHIGEKYALLVVEVYPDQFEDLPYKLENLPTEDEFEDEEETPFFSPT
jgi:hypothetical protein